MNHSRKSNKTRSAFSLFLEDFCPGVFCNRFITYFSICFEIAVGTCTTRMYHTFWNPFPVEMRHLFQELIVLERSRPSVSDCS